MSRALRSNFEFGSVREAARRAQWKALGLSDDDFEKPKIAVVNSSSELAICFRHLDGVAARRQRGDLGGGRPAVRDPDDGAERLHRLGRRRRRLNPVRRATWS